MNKCQETAAKELAATLNNISMSKNSSFQVIIVWYVVMVCCYNTVHII